MPLHRPQHQNTQPHYGPAPNLPPQAHIGPHHGASYPSPPAGYSSPPPLGAPAYVYSSPQQGMALGPPHIQPAMVYGPPAPHQQQQQQQQHQQPWILLGFQDTLSSQKAVYGPPGSHFDMAGNVFFEHEGGSKEYVLPYRGYDGRIRNPPQPEDDCCGFWHWVGYRTDYHWQSPHYQSPQHQTPAIAR